MEGFKNRGLEVGGGGAYPLDAGNTGRPGEAAGGRRIARTKGYERKPSDVGAGASHTLLVGVEVCTAPWERNLAGPSENENAQPPLPGRSTF